MGSYQFYYLNSNYAIGTHFKTIELKKKITIFFIIVLATVYRRARLTASRRQEREIEKKTVCGVSACFAHFVFSRNEKLVDLKHVWNALRRDFRRKRH